MGLALGGFGQRSAGSVGGGWGGGVGSGQVGWGGGASPK